MSDSTSAPAAPAAPAQTSDRGPVIAPPPASQPAIGVSEAARLLSAQRRQQAAKDGAPPTAAPAAATVKPSPNEMVAAPATKAPDAATAPAAAPARKAADTGLSAMERALGVPGDGTTAPAADAGATIEIEGERYSPAQLREAVLKSSDYTKKTMELAERGRQLQAQQEALAQVLPYIQPELAKLAAAVQAQASKPDITLMQTDPQRYFTELHAYETTREEQNRLAGLNTLQAQAHQRAIEAQVTAANEQLAKELPFWADPQERLAAQQQIVDWATNKAGFNRDELRGLTDPRALKLMMKAMQFDKWVDGAKTAAPRQATIAPVRGSPPPPPPTERVSVASEAFEARPNVRTGAQLLAARRANGSAPR